MFLHLARTSGGYRAAGDGPIRPSFPYFVTYYGDDHSYNACCCHQRCSRMEWYDSCTIIHAWFLEPHFCLAQGTLYVYPYNPMLNLCYSLEQLLLPWRLFRLWALMDGVDPPENMVRCMANNYSPLGFWRSWHRSFNLWIVRYLYIPLGGTHRLVATSVLIFTFVALWHDLSPRLLAWGWLVVLFILPEVMARKALPPSMVRVPLFPR